MEIISLYLETLQDQLSGFSNLWTYNNTKN